MEGENVSLYVFVVLLFPPEPQTPWPELVHPYEVRPSQGQEESLHSDEL